MIDVIICIILISIINMTNMVNMINSIGAISYINMIHEIGGIESIMVIEWLMLKIIPNGHRKVKSQNVPNVIGVMWS
jgi:hypothetical protein